MRRDSAVDRVVGVVGLVAFVLGLTLYLYAQAPGGQPGGLPPAAPGGPAPGAPGGGAGVAPGGPPPGGGGMPMAPGFQPGGPAGPGMPSMGGMPSSMGGGMGGSPAIAVQGVYVYVVHGDILFQFSTDGLRLVKWAKLEVPMETAAPARTKPGGERPPEGGKPMGMGKPPKTQR